MTFIYFYELTPLKFKEMDTKHDGHWNMFSPASKMATWGYLYVKFEGSI